MQKRREGKILATQAVIELGENHNVPDQEISFIN